MTRQMLLVSTLVFSLAAHGADLATENLNASAGFSRLKTLVGDWQADTQTGKARVTYELVSGGSVLVGHERVENMPEMMTVYYLDGNRLLLTHYCMLGNQPRMQAQPFNAASGELKFQFLDATNLKSPGDGHMHDAKIRFTDENHIVTEWQLYESGQPKMTETAQFTRTR